MPMYISPNGVEHRISNAESAIACALSDVGLPNTGVWPNTYLGILRRGGVATIAGPNGTATIVPDASTVGAPPITEKIDFSTPEATAKSKKILLTTIGIYSGYALSLFLLVTEGFIGLAPAAIAWFFEMKLRFDKEKK